MVNFEWDEVKNAENQEKHGIAFEYVETVLVSGNVEFKYDDEHSMLDEHRFLATVMTKDYGEIVVSIVDIDEDTTRIISARKK